MPPPNATAAICVPSAEEATYCQLAPGALDGVHVNPPFVEAEMPPPYDTAASRVRSAEPAMEYQPPTPLVCVHVPPLFVEMKMPAIGLPALATAANRVPSAEETMPCQ